MPRLTACHSKQNHSLFTIHYSLLKIEASFQIPFNQKDDSHYQYDNIEKDFHKAWLHDEYFKLYQSLSITYAIEKKSTKNLAVSRHHHSNAIAVDLYSHKKNSYHFWKKDMKPKVLIARNPKTAHNIYDLSGAYPDFSVVTTDSGHEAIRLIREEGDFFVVFLFADLQDLNGYETALTIRQLYQDLPIILLVHYNNLQSLRLATMVGCTQLLQLPLDEEEMLMITRKHLNTKLLKELHR